MLFAPTREESNEIADAKITIHDRHRFEIKLDVELANPDKSGYRVDTYFFVPRALNVGPNTYSKELFYSSIQRYIRFKTPHFSLAAIIDPSNTASPMTRIRQVLPRLEGAAGDGPAVEALLSETKLLGAVSRGAIRDTTKDLLAELAATGATAGGDAGDRFAARVLRFLGDLTAYVEAVSGLRSEMRGESVPTRLREAIAFFDEFTSLTIEDYLSTLLHALRLRPGLATTCGEADALVAAMIARQQSHRMAAGYPSVLANATTDSTVLYRRGVLKKFISNALFLDTEVSEGPGLSQVPLAIAAGFAMLFAVIVTLFAQTRYTTNSVPFVVVVVLSYIFKDRLKDWLKLYLSKGMVRWTADRKTKIRDPYSGRVIGTLKEAFSFTDQARIPPEVRQARQMDDITSIDEQGKPERIIRYEKEVSLFRSRISRAHQRRRDLNDIMRLSIDDFLKHADDPTVDYLHLDAATGQLQQVPCKRVYHVNIVFAYGTNDVRTRVERIERIRLVLNRDGIVRLDPVL